MKDFWCVCITEDSNFSLGIAFRPQDSYSGTAPLLLAAFIPIDVHCSFFQLSYFIGRLHLKLIYQCNSLAAPSSSQVTFAR